MSLRALFFDCIAGISGDMALGALIDAGADLRSIRSMLSTLPVEPFDMDVERVESHGLPATRVHVRTQATGLIRTYASIRALIDDASLPHDAAELARRIFRRLAEAEAVVHGRDVEQVTFHEAGAVDSVVDICGTAIAFTQLGIERAFSSSVPTGLGMARTEHGTMPIPAPAVVELLRGAPLYSRGVPFELVTPTGAAILASTVESYGEMPSMRVDSVGYGAGSNRTDFPDVLRVLIGEEVTDTGGARASGEVLLETNVDDLNPEVYDFVLERLQEAGAHDAWLTPIVMKKGRQAVKVSVVCSAGEQEAIRRVLFRETGTLGVRAVPVDERELERETITAATRFGAIRVKVGWLDKEAVSVSPDYEDCANAARGMGVPVRDVDEEAARLGREELAGRRGD
jgi:uncharacterized protein (TIGR00299 family) protein